MSSSLTQRLDSLRKRLQSGLTRLSDALVHYSIRFSPTEVQRTFGVTLIVGASCGVLAVAFHGAILLASQLLIEPAMHSQWWPLWTIVTPTVGGLLAGIALHHLPQARGSGIPQVKAAYAVQTARLRFRDGFAKFWITVLQLGSGASLGREGPTVQICASLSGSLGRWFALAPRSVRRLLPVGGAAGVAAAFNAPIAAVTFTVEEVVGGLDQTVLSGVVVAAALAAIIEHTILGSHPILTLTHSVHGLEHATALPFYALLGLANGLIAVGFSRSLLSLRKDFVERVQLPSWSKPAVGGLCTGVCAVVALGWVDASGIAGGGYEQLSETINGVVPLKVLLVLGALKFVATIFSYASGGAGGLFAPTLFLGAMVGGAVGWLDTMVTGNQYNHAFALVGMGAAFAGTIRAPITSVLIIFEMTGGYALVLPLMISNTVSYMVARKLQPTGLYDSLLEQDGVHLIHRGAGHLEGMLVEEAMKVDVVTLSAHLSAREALQKMHERPYSTYPVVAPDGRCLGLVNRARVQRVIAEGHAEQAMSELARLKEYLYARDPMMRAVVRMNALGTRQLPVVTEGSMKLVGLITMSDIFSVQARVAREGLLEEPGSRPAEGALG